MFLTRCPRFIPTRHNYLLALWQSHFERILAGWVGELAVPIYREREVTGFTQDDFGVNITPWADRVQLIDAKYVGVWGLPVIGR